MAVVLPLIGGVLLGRFVEWTWAVVGQAALAVIAIVVLTLTAPEHGGSYNDAVVITAIVVLLSALTLFLGRLWRRRVAVD
jgi:hypothetical protein